MRPLYADRQRLRGQSGASRRTHRMLVFARRQALNFSRLDIVALVYGMAELLEPISRSFGGIETLISAWLPRGTQTRTSSNGCSNLAVNARDASRKGSHCSSCPAGNHRTCTRSLQLASMSASR